IIWIIDSSNNLAGRPWRARHVASGGPSVRIKTDQNKRMRLRGGNGQRQQCVPLAHHLVAPEWRLPSERHSLADACFIPHAPPDAAASGLGTGACGFSVQVIGESIERRVGRCVWALHHSTKGTSGGGEEQQGN